MENAILIPLGLFVLVSALTIVSGVLKQPGIGVLASLLVVGLASWLRRPGRLAEMGLSAPESWLATVGLGLLLGSLIAVLTTALLEPLIERVTGQPHDFSVVDPVRGSVKALVQWLALVWVLAAFIEELVYRGFLTREAMHVLGNGLSALAAIILLTSVVFGLAHTYQGISGTISTGIVGLMLALIYVLGGFNLWLPIFTHGFIDTVSLVLTYFNGDRVLRRVLWRDPAE